MRRAASSGMRLLLRRQGTGPAQQQQDASSSVVPHAHQQQQQLQQWWRRATTNTAQQTGAAAASAAAPAASKLAEVNPKTLSLARRAAFGIGGVVGAVGAVMGVGGGVLLVPAITGPFPSIPQCVVSGTSLAAVAATGTVASAVYLGAGQVDMTSAALLAAGAIVTAPLGARATSRLDCAALRRALGLFLLCAAPLVPAKALALAFGHDGDSNDGSSSSSSSKSGDGDKEAPAAAAAAAAATSDAPANALALRPLKPSDAVVAATGCVAGFASGLLGIGGGIVMTPALALLTDMPHTMVLGTSLAAMVVPSLVGLRAHSLLGNVDWRMAGALALSTPIGAYASSGLALKAPPGVLEAVFSLGMLFLGRKTLAAAAATKAAKAAKAAAAAAAAIKAAGAAVRPTAAATTMAEPTAMAMRAAAK